MKIRIFTDGGSKGNPGPSSIGVVAYKLATGQGGTLDTELFRYREDIGVGTNNEAEYTALIRALELLNKKINTHEIDEEVESVECLSDSTLMVNQVTGKFKITKPHIHELVNQVKKLKDDINAPVTHRYIPREQNTLADALVNNEA